MDGVNWNDRFSYNIYDSKANDADLGIARNRKINSYVSTPAGLLKYFRLTENDENLRISGSPQDFKTHILSNTMPFDPNHPWRNTGTQNYLWGEIKCYWYIPMLEI